MMILKIETTYYKGLISLKVSITPKALKLMSRGTIVDYISRFVLVMLYITLPSAERAICRTSNELALELT